MASVKVAVRVRPFNGRERQLNSSCVVEMNNNQVRLKACQDRDNSFSTEKQRRHDFTFDHAYWSHDPASRHRFDPQSKVYEDLGLDVVKNAFGGYNVCVFAYGQTGSGKTYTMMGNETDRGLIPRICETMFEKMSAGKEEGTSYRTEVSYLEIYNERVKDLLNKNSSHNLKVREHPTQGPYVQDLSKHLVLEYDQILQLMEKGNVLRTTASTNMNDTSSRSHAIFTITFVQAGYLEGMPHETKSKIHLVDLAGSERANATGATGQRLKEGAHINKSLVTLGSVISALAEASVKAQHSSKQVFIPYRDSVLTWLLKDSLGGNSKTIMIATISPAEVNHGETLSTLRYANRAKNIINKPTVNEDPNVKLIRELREEIEKLKCIMSGDPEILANMQEQLARKQEQEQHLTHEWNEKWREAATILKEHNALGLKRTGLGVVLDSDKPHLIGLDEDILSTGITLYQLRDGDTIIGSDAVEDGTHILLKGPCIQPLHCTIRLEEGVATLMPSPGALCLVNAAQIETPVRLSQGCVIVLGKTNMFRYNDPMEAASLRRNMSEKSRKASLMNQSLLSQSLSDLRHPGKDGRKQSGEFKMFASDGDIKDIAEETGKRQSQDSVESVATLKHTNNPSTSDSTVTTPRMVQDKMDELNLQEKESSLSVMGSLDEMKMINASDSDLESFNDMSDSNYDMNANPALHSTKLGEDFGVSCAEIPDPEHQPSPVPPPVASSATAMSVTTPSEAGCSDSDSASHYPGSHASSGPGTREVTASGAALSHLYQEICDQKDVIMSCLEEDNCDIDQLNQQIAKLQGMQDSYSRLELESTKSLWLSQASEDGSLYQDRFAVIVEAEVDRRLEAELDLRAERERQERELLLLEKEQEMERLRLEHEREMYRMKKKLSQGAVSMPAEPTTRPAHRLSCGFQVSIPRWKTVSAGNNPFVEYEVEINMLEQDISWRLFRRFRQFRDLHVQLSQKYGDDVAKIQFPSRKIFGSMSAAVSNLRQRELQSYLNRLIATGCKLSTSPLYKEQTRESLARFAPFFLTNNSDDLHF